MRNFLIFCLFLSPIVAASQKDTVSWEYYSPFPPAVNEALDFTGFKVTWKSVLTQSLFALCGTAHGMGEAYHADPYVFEKKWGVDEYSFFGSEAWQRNYFGRRFNPVKPNKHKNNLGNPVRDVHHAKNALTRAGVVSASFSIGLRKEKLKFKLARLAVGGFLYSSASWYTYNNLR